MTDYKLTYLDLKGRGEPIRLIFAYTQTAYEDYRIPYAQLDQMSASFPFGTLPILETEGQVIAQTHAICGYLGKKLGLSGENDIEDAKCFMITGGMEDIFWRLGRRFGDKTHEQQQQILQEFSKESLPPFFAQIEAILKKNGTGFLVGEKLTWTDFFVFNGIEFMTNLSPVANMLDQFTHIKAFQQKISNLPNVKEYIENRPKTAL